MSLGRKPRESRCVRAAPHPPGRETGARVGPRTVSYQDEADLLSRGKSVRGHKEHDTWDGPGPARADQGAPAHVCRAVRVC